MFHEGEESGGNSNLNVKHEQGGEGRGGEGRGGDSISHIQTLVSFLSSLSFYYSWTSQK